MSFEERSIDRQLGNVTLSQEDARQAVRLFRLLSEAMSNPDNGELSTRFDRVDKACTIFRARKARTRFLNRAMSGEPAWDMLLALFINQEAERKLTAAKLSEIIGEPPSTISRWLDYLEKERLIERIDDPLDKRSYLTRLTEKGRTVMDDYLANSPWPGLPGAPDQPG